jgi:hypothetical protein
MAVVICIAGTVVVAICVRPGGNRGSSLACTQVHPFPGYISSACYKPPAVQGFHSGYFGGVGGETTAVNHTAVKGPSTEVALYIFELYKERNSD